MKPTALLLRGADVWAPEPLGRTDVLAVHDQVVAIGGDLRIPPWADGTVVECGGMRLIPGLVDQHVHIAGGGGEGGPQNRTPEMPFSMLTRHGITTVVGVLGTDGTTRSVPDLLAKARALSDEGITAYLYTGAYEVPTRTVTGNPRSDIVLLDRVLGIGEIALSDHRGSHPSDQALLELASEARVGGLLAGKAGVLHLHVGSGKRRLDPLFEIVSHHDLPIQTLVPTHLNRTRELVAAAEAFARRGGFVDITSGITPSKEDDRPVWPAEAVSELIRHGVPLDQISMSSDAGGSDPRFDAAGRLVGIGVGSPASLLAAVRDLVSHHGWAWSEALRPVTTTPARILRLDRVGRIRPGGQADLVLLRDDGVDTVVARGRIMVRDGRVLVRGVFEEPTSWGG